MRKITTGTLSTLLTAATLLLLVPSALCQSADDCPMRSEVPRSTAEAMTCVPGPAFDCCQGDQAPAQRTFDEGPIQRLIAVHPDQSPYPAAPRRPPALHPAPSFGTGGAALHTPLYTLLTTLLI